MSEETREAWHRTADRFARRARRAAMKADRARRRGKVRDEHAWKVVAAECRRECARARLMGEVVA